MVTGAIFAAFADLLERRTGQQILPSRNWRIDATLRPMLGELGVADLAGLVGRMAGDDALSQRVTELLLNNETSFFRDIKVFDAITRDALPDCGSSMIGDGPLP